MFGVAKHENHACRQGRLAQSHRCLVCVCCDSGFPSLDELVAVRLLGLGWPVLSVIVVHALMDAGSCDRRKDSKNFGFPFVLFPRSRLLQTDPSGGRTQQLRRVATAGNPRGDMNRHSDSVAK